jgi:HK97 family phage prohead protease
MKTNLKLSNLLPCLSPDVREGIEAADGFDGSVNIKRMSVKAVTEKLEEGERAVVRYISTRDVDRDNEVLVPGGMVSSDYEKNPVVMWAHDYSLPPIGKSEWLKTDKQGIKSKTVYAETERAEEVWQLIKQGFLQTASVGFMPMERVWRGEQGWVKLVNDLNAKWDIDLEKAGAQVITTKWQLLEYSDVPIPANPNALTIQVAKGLALSEDMVHQLGIEPEARRIVEEVKRHIPRTVEVIKTATTHDDNRRVIAIVEDTLARMQGRL